MKSKLDARVVEALGDEAWKGVRRSVQRRLVRWATRYGYEGWLVLRGGSSRSLEAYAPLAQSARLGFQQEPYFAHVFGLSQPDLWGFFHWRTGRCQLFVDVCARADVALDVSLQSVRDEAEALADPRLGPVGVSRVADLPLWVSERRARGDGFAAPALLAGSLSAAPNGGGGGGPEWTRWLAGLAVDGSGELLQRSRASKTRRELCWMAATARLSRLAHQSVRRALLRNLGARGCSPPLTEFDVCQHFREFLAAYGVFSLSYGTICSVGARHNLQSHYHAPALGSAPIVPNQAVLLDAAARCKGYCTDITRMHYYHSGGSPRAFVDAMAQVLWQRRVLRRALRPGVLVRSVQDLSYRLTALSLQRLGVLGPGPEGRTRELAAWERRVADVFMPFGFGHPVGLEVHDVRLDRVVLGAVWAVEPGLFFDPEALARSREFAPCLRARPMAALLALGQVRSEEVYLVGPEATTLLVECDAAKLYR